MKKNLFILCLLISWVGQASSSNLNVEEEGEHGRTSSFVTIDELLPEYLKASDKGVKGRKAANKQKAKGRKQKRHHKGKHSRGGREKKVAQTRVQTGESDLEQKSSTVTTPNYKPQVKLTDVSRRPQNKFHKVSKRNRVKGHVRQHSAQPQGNEVKEEGKEALYIPPHKRNGAEHEKKEVQKEQSVPPRKQGKAPLKKKNGYFSGSAGKADADKDWRATKVTKNPPKSSSPDQTRSTKSKVEPKQKRIVQKTIRKRRALKRQNTHNRKGGARKVDSSSNLKQ